MIKLCVFDFDSTLMDGETITNLASVVGKSEEVREITRRAMEGELSFFEALQERVKFLKGVKVKKAKEICDKLPFIEGAKDTIKYLKDKNIKVVVFSGGFHFATDVAKQKLGFDASFANHLDFEGENLTGRVGGEMMFDTSKGVILKELKSLLDLKKDEVMVVGDGANDISMFKEAGLKIAFCAKEILKKKADICIEKKDLREIKKYV